MEEESVVKSMLLSLLPAPSFAEPILTLDPAPSLIFKSNGNVYINDLCGSTSALSPMNPSTGTEYGGSNFVISKTTNELIFSSNGRFYRVSLIGGETTPFTVALGDKIKCYGGANDGNLFCCTVETQKNTFLGVIRDFDKLHEEGWVDRVNPIIPTLYPRFYFDPDLYQSANGSVQAVWNQWTAPNMSWDGSVIEYCSDIRAVNNSSINIETIFDGQFGGFNCSQPRFSPDGKKILYLSEKDSNFLNLWLYNIETKQNYPLTTKNEEIAYVTWVCGNRNFAFLSNHHILYTSNYHGNFSIHLLVLGKDPANYNDIEYPPKITDKKLSSFEDGFYFNLNSNISSKYQNNPVPGRGGEISVFSEISGEIPKHSDFITDGKDFNIFGPVHEHNRGVYVSFSYSSYNVISDLIVVKFNDIHTNPLNYTARKIATSGIKMDPSISSLFVPPQHISYETNNNELAHALYFTTNKITTKGNDLPPMILFLHGGPTGMIANRYPLHFVPFLLRGYVVCCPNYRGSCGYGKEYRHKLHGNWGVYDMMDAVNAAKEMIRLNLCDPKKIVVMGGSAGGFTTLNCLIHYSNMFCCGVDMCGVADLFGLSEDTHLFEKYYNDQLIGKLPEHTEKYIQNSPINQAWKIVKPLIIIQGEIDTVVTKAHSLKIKSSVKGPVEYIEYAGEGHMLSSPKTLIDMMYKIIKFLQKYVEIDK